MKKYCGVCNAPVTEWDENLDYGQCEHGHSVQAVCCTDEPDKKLAARIKRRARYHARKNKENLHD